MMNFAAVLLVTLAGCGLCRVLHVAVAPIEVWTAAAIVGIVSQLALIPLIIARNGNQAALSQASLISTTLHLLLSAGIGLAAASSLHTSQRFLYWLCAFFWATLASVATTAVRAVKSAPVPQ